MRSAVTNKHFIKETLSNSELKEYLIQKDRQYLFSSTTGAAGFAVEGSSGGNPSLRLLSACEK